jgi:hypothetical protein
MRNLSRTACGVNLVGWVEGISMSIFVIGLILVVALLAMAMVFHLPRRKK